MGSAELRARWQAIFPAYGMVVALTNGVHDYWGVLIFACIGVVMGLLVQRAFWVGWYTPRDLQAGTLLFSFYGLAWMWLLLVIVIGVISLPSSSTGYALSGGSIALAVLILTVMISGEYLNLRLPRIFTQHQFFAVEPTHAFLLLFANVVFVALAMVDSYA